MAWYCRQIQPALENFQEDGQGYPLNVNLQSIPAPQSAYGMMGGGCFGGGPGMKNEMKNELHFLFKSTGLLLIHILILKLYNK